MSSILKALRKLEEEKVRSGENRVDIAADILRGEGGRKRTGGRPALWLLLLAVGVLLGGGLYLVLFQPGGGPAGRQQVVGEAPPLPSAGTVGEKPSSGRGGERPGREGSVSPAAAGAVRLPEESPGHPARPPLVQSKAADTVTMTVSGIVYQDAPEKRMAIVNDLPVMTGAVVDGWRVEKILRDRVIFRDGEQRLSVPLTGAD